MLKKFNCFIVFGFVLSLASIFMSSPLHAQGKASAPQGDEVQPVNLNIAVIDVDSIRVQAKVVKDIAAQIKKSRDKFQAEITNDEKKLREAQKELKRQEAILSDEAFKANVLKFQNKVQTVQIKIQRLKQQLAIAQGESMRKVEVALNGIIDKLVTELDLHIVFRREPVVYYNQGLDLTKVVLERLDKQMPSLKVKKMEIPSARPSAKAKVAPKAAPKAKAPAKKK